jgi:hypothetical protein
MSLRRRGGKAGAVPRWPRLPAWLPTAGLLASADPAVILGQASLD